MKNLNMDVYGVEAMSKQETQKTDGGAGPIFWLIVGVLVAECLDPDASEDFKKGEQAARDFWGA